MTPQNGISLLNKPTNTIITFSQLKLCCRCLAFPPSEFLCLGKHFPRKLVSFKNRAGNPYTMKEPIKTRIYRERNGDECVMGLEQEAFIDGSSEFRPMARANGFESTLNRSSKWLVAIFFAAAILWRHDAEAMWAALGCTLNAGFSNMLKRILNQERPLSTSKSDPGMPSSHAQSIFFTAMFANFSYIPTSYSYWGASLVLYHLTLPKVQHLESYSWAMLLLPKIPASYSCWGASVMLYLRNSLRVVELLGVNAFTTTIIGLIFALGSYLTWLRVSLQFHTISQVAVGAAVGSIFSILWFWSWNAIVFDAYYSYLWVRIIVVLGAAGYSLAFLLFIIRYWVMESIVNFVSIQIKNL